MGDISRAYSELKLMEDRGLVDFVPELLIEKAGQLSTASDRLDEAAQCIDNAHRQLIDYPVNEITDVHLSERAAFQYLDVANRYAATGDRARSLVCLERTAKMASRSRAINESIVSQSLELGQKWETDKDLHTAEKCYNLAAETDPTDHRSRYGLARVALKQGKLYTAIRALRRLIEIPDGPKQVVADILSPAAAARLLDYWPATPKSILRPIKLSAYGLAWAVQRMVRSGFYDFFGATTTLLMIWMFVARHFFRRLRADVGGIQRASRTLRSRLFRNFPAATYHVTSCPICGSAGNFEYENKLTPLFRCRKCDHVYARELPDDKA
jgi:tetratricopeptide (TPR) repeat protein